MLEPFLEGWLPGLRARAAVCCLLRPVSGDTGEVDSFCHVVGHDPSVPGHSPTQMGPASSPSHGLDSAQLQGQGRAQCRRLGLPWCPQCLAPGEDMQAGPITTRPTRGVLWCPDTQWKEINIHNFLMLMNTLHFTLQMHINIFTYSAM